MIRRIALLGAAATGKTRLTGELQAALDKRPTPHPTFLITDNPPVAVLTTNADGMPSHPRFDQVLLMGLDLPASASLAALQEAADQQLRLLLANADVPYTVVYGQGPLRLTHALNALQGGSSSAGRPRQPWVWACDNCSDPGCERRLLSDLLERRPR